MIPLRAEANSVVASATVDGRTVFLTARSLPFVDAEICNLLNRRVPNAFPQTIAYDDRRGWWLTADIGARDSKSFVEGDEVDRRMFCLVRGLADVQQATAAAPDLASVSFNVSRDTMREGVEHALEESQSEVRWSATSRASLLARVEDLWSKAGVDRTPVSWIHSDPSPDNVRVDERGRVAFIDLEDPWYGPMPLMGALTLHSLSRRCGWTARDHSRYSRVAWRHYVGACGLVPELYAFDDWLRLALLVRLVRSVEKAATGPSLLLHEETPRRSRAIARDLQRLLGPS